MKYLLHPSTIVLVAVCATWAYRVNYATQEALNRVADLEAEIAREREALAVLGAEWAYLNRPDRLRALVDANAAALGLVPLDPAQYGEVAMVPFPPEPEPEPTEAVLSTARHRPMIRRPLRPLARVLTARAEGTDPNLVEAEERAARLAAMQRAERARAETRLLLLGVAFVLGFSIVAGRMALLAAAVPVEPRAGSGAAPIHRPARRDRRPQRRGARDQHRHRLALRPAAAR